MHPQPTPRDRRPVDDKPDWTRLPVDDDPRTRIVEHLTQTGWVIFPLTWRGWTLARRGRWVAKIDSAAGGKRALLNIMPPDGFWLVDGLADEGAYAEALEHLGLAPRELWRRDLVDGLNVPR